MKVTEGNLIAKDLKFAIVVARFNDFVSEHLVNGALDALNRHGAKTANIETIKVPGAFEIPYVAKKIAGKNAHDAIICLGAVIRGATPHFEYVSGEVAKGIANAAMETGLPIIFGVVTTDSIEQAIERAGSKSGNKGWDAAMAAIEMANLYKNL